MKVFNVKAEIRTILQSVPVTRKGEVLVSANSPDEITLEVLNRPQYLSRLIPRFITGALRNGYKCSKIILIKEVNEKTN